MKIQKIVQAFPFHTSTGAWRVMKRVVPEEGEEEPKKPVAQEHVRAKVTTMRSPDVASWYSGVKEHGFTSWTSSCPAGAFLK